jgi:GTP-binding protein Era
VRSAFVSLVGRPNVGKSTLLNALVGKKVSIVSDKPQTTRTRVRGILNKYDAQLVFVDTPGLHKASTALGERVNATALESMRDVDIVCLVIDATQKFGAGDMWVSDQLNLKNAIVVINKIDLASQAELLAQLSAISMLGAAEYFPVSAKTGEGIDQLVDELVKRAPLGQAMYPPEMTSETPQAQWVAELVREQLLAVTRDELPYSIATRVTEWEWPRVRCEIVVERESQKGMVIGKSGSVLKSVGIEVRKQMPEGAFLELFVVVDKDWQHRPDRVERLGYSIDEISRRGRL